MHQFIAPSPPPLLAVAPAHAETVPVRAMSVYYELERDGEPLTPATKAR